MVFLPISIPAMTLGYTTFGISTLSPLTDKIVKKWKSSEARRNAEQKANQLESIQNDIDKLQKTLTKECEISCREDSSPDEVQVEITARILKAMAKRKGRDLTLNCLRHLVRNDDIATSIDLDKTFFENVSILLTCLGYSFSLKTLPQTGQIKGELLGLGMTFPDLINNCEKLIKDKHLTEAYTSLKTKVEAMCDALEKLRMQLNSMQEILYQMECEITLDKKNTGSQIYTQGSISLKYKQHQKQIHKFTLICSNDIAASAFNASKYSANGMNAQSNTTGFERFPNDVLLAQSQQHRCIPWIPNFCWIINFPWITLSNVRSLPNKMEQILELVKKTEMSLLGHSDLIFFTETWLKQNSCDVNLPLYDSYRADRDLTPMTRMKGGGMIAYISEAWGTIAEYEHFTEQKYELMQFVVNPAAHPHLPFIFIQVYVPGRTKLEETAKTIAGFYSWFENHAPVFLLGDFNQCDVSPFLSAQQYVTCPTRKNAKLDKCYGNVQGVYACKCSAPLGMSDHNVIHLVPGAFSKCKHEEVERAEKDKEMCKQSL